MKERYITSLERLLLQNHNLESIPRFKGLIFHITKKEKNIIDILSNPQNHGRSPTNLFTDHTTQTICTSQEISHYIRKFCQRIKG